MPDNIIEIGIGNEILGISTYDIQISDCTPTNWQTVATDLSLSDFPFDINLDFWCQVVVINIKLRLILTVFVQVQDGW